MLKLVNKFFKFSRLSQLHTPSQMIQNYLQLVVTLLIATLIILIIFKLSSTHKKEENSLDTKRRGKTLLITGPIKSGKTLLYQKLLDVPKLLQTVHSLRENTSQLEKWKLVDLPLDEKRLHSQPADYFHFNDLAGLILCLNHEKTVSDLVVVMSVAVGILKNVPICILTTISKEDVQSVIIKTLYNLQNSRLSSLLSTAESSISFEDPINRLIFESVEGEVATDYESRIREYFDEQVTTCESSDQVKKWIHAGNL